MSTVVDLATVEQVKGYLGINSNVDDALLERLVHAASGFIQTWIGRNLGSQRYIKRLNGNDSDVMMFPEYPVTTVNSVRVNDSTVPASPGTSQYGYVFDERTIALRGHRFYRGRMNIYLDFVAGYETIPQELTQACVELVAMRYKEKDRIGLTSKGLAGEAIGYSQKDMAESTSVALQKYKKVYPG